MSIFSNPPKCTPMPPMKARHPPLQIINIFKQYHLTKSLSLSIVAQNKEEEQNLSNYKTLYQQKCQFQSHLKSQINAQKLKILQQQQKIIRLQQQIKILQEEKRKKYDYSIISSGRNRSKSQRKLIPTIEVKVPNNMKQQITQNHEQSNQTDRLRDQIDQYKRQLQIYIETVERLNNQIQALNRQLKGEKQANRYNGQQHIEKKQQANMLKPQNSPMQYNNYIQNKIQARTQTPRISQFSPLPQISVQTVKKQGTRKDQMQFQIKRLKNQVLYKDLLLNKMIKQHKKQSVIYERHLTLSVEENKKISEAMSETFSDYKTQILSLRKQLQQIKNNKQKLQRQMQRYRSISHIQSQRQKRVVNNQAGVVDLLSIRRNQKLYINQ